MTKKLSLILPVLNNIETLDDTLGSIIDQTNKNFELFIIDDNSTDGSSNILRKFSEKYNCYYKKIYTDYDSKFLNGINVEVGTEAKNLGFSLCNSDYAFAIGNEILFKNTIEIITSVLEIYKNSHLIFDIMNIPRNLCSSLRKKKFDIHKFQKEIKSKNLNQDELIKFTNNQTGILNRMFPNFCSELPFNFKNNFMLRKLFYNKFEPLPGCAGSALFHKNIYKNDLFRNIDKRLYPSFNGRGNDRDLNLRVIKKYSNSIKISLPIFPACMDHEIDKELIENYLI